MPTRASLDSIFRRNSARWLKEVSSPLFSLVEIKLAGGDDFGGSGQQDFLAFPTQIERTGGCGDAHRTLHQPSRESGRRRARGSGSRAHLFSRSALEKPDTERVR